MSHGSFVLSLAEHLWPIFCSSPPKKSKWLLLSNMPVFSLEGTGIEIRRRLAAFTEVIRTYTKIVHFKMADEHLNGDTTLGGDGAVSEGCLPAECKFKVHTFFDTLLEQKVQFQILKMTDSLYVWIGTSSEMNALTVAMCTKYVSSLWKHVL